MDTQENQGLDKEQPQPVINREFWAALENFKQAVSRELTPVEKNALYFGYVTGMRTSTLVSLECINVALNDLQVDAKEKL